MPNPNLHSNTSHVTINPFLPEESTAIHLIQIHLMLLLISHQMDSLSSGRNSNTSHVTINRNFNQNRNAKVVFKYISCYY